MEAVPTPVEPAETEPQRLRVLIANGRRGIVPGDRAAADPAYVKEAAKRGVFAYIVDTTPEELQSAIDITLQRFTEYHSLQGAFGRRAIIEQAKGGQKLADVAAAIVDSHLLLATQPPEQIQR